MALKSSTCDSVSEQVLYDGFSDSYWFDGKWIPASSFNIQQSEKFQIKDSRKRETFPSGMQRDTTEGKINWALVADGPMLKRWATHLTNGAKKYDKRNWMKAEGLEELERARESAFRHFMLWYLGEVDEDHASATFFNINEVEFIRGKLENK